MKQLFLTASILAGIFGVANVIAGSQPQTSIEIQPVPMVTTDALDAASLADDICWVAPEWRED
jgi:hypothetical protein